MGMISIDETKCKKDAMCARECAVAIIRLKDPQSFPEMVPGGEQICLICGHCVAVCPHGAFNHSRVPMDNCPPIRSDLAINEQQAVQFLRSRRSIRRFRDAPVEREKIQRLIEIARYAPTGGNGQWVEWLVFTDREKIHQIAASTVDWMREAIQKAQAAFPPYLPIMVATWDAGHDAVLWKAPALVIASAPAEASTGMVDLTLALSYLELAAPTLGLGTCWAGVLHGALLASPSLRTLVGIPEGHPHHYPMMLGYPRLKYHRLPERKPPKITWR